MAQTLITTTKTMQKLGHRWVRDYRAAGTEQRAEMIEQAESVYEGMDYSNKLVEHARQGFDPEDSDYAIVSERGERGAYICRHPGTGAMYVTHWDSVEDMDDTSFAELGIDNPAPAPWHQALKGHHNAHHHF